MSTRHKHYDVIVAFAEGKTVQSRLSALDQWKDWIHPRSPSFNPLFNTEYRIKPQKTWRWVVSPVDDPNNISITHDHFSDPEQVHRYFRAVKLSVHQPVLSTEKEM